MTISPLTTAFKRYGSGEIEVAFTDTLGVAVTPLTASWTLSDLSGNVVNSRQSVAITPLDTAVTIKLSGADLEAAAGSAVTRELSVQGTYTDRDGATARFSGATYITIDRIVGAVSP